LTIRAVSERLKIGKTLVSTYLLRAREAGLAAWPLPPGPDDDELLSNASSAGWGVLFGTAMSRMAEGGSELKRKGVTLNLLWQEYRDRLFSLVDLNIRIRGSNRGP